MARFRKKTIHEIADMICGNFSQAESYFTYRSSSYLTEFFEDCDLEQYVHDGSTRKWWVANVLQEILNQPSNDATLPSPEFQTVIQALMDRADHVNEDSDRSGALIQLNASLSRERLEAFYAEDNLCYLKSTRTGITSRPGPVLDRALSRDELDRRGRLEAFLDQSSEDDLIEKVLFPLFQTLGFRRISIAGHDDKVLEYGKDVWMKYRLPTGHWIYLGLQAKRGKIDAAARTKNDNVAEIHRQVIMMLGHEIFDTDTNRKHLVDHAMIVAGGTITKQAKNWLGERLDASRRSQILFMDRADILHLYVVHNVPMPDEQQGAKTSSSIDIDFLF